jgi:hypothetical protein
MTTYGNAPDGLDEGWAQAVGEADKVMRAALAAIPVGRRAEYAADMMVWARNCSDQMIAAGVATLSAEGLSQPEVAAAMRMSVNRLRRVLRTTNTDLYGKDWSRWEMPKHYHDIRHLMEAR